jgi:hypothetical protein
MSVIAIGKKGGMGEYEEEGEGDKEVHEWWVFEEVFRVEEMEEGAKVVGGEVVVLIDWVALVGYDLEVFDDDECIVDVEVELIIDEFVGELVECLFLLL